MAMEYAVWLSAKTLKRRPPFRRYGEAIRVGNWLHFSEYWNCRKGIEAEDRDVVRLCKLRCHPNEAAVDVGANIGLFSALLSESGFPRVLSFEPAPLNYERLLQNINVELLKSNRIEVIHAAVGEQVGNVRFALNRQSPGTCKIAAAKDIGPADEIIEVPVLTLDSVCAERGIVQIGFLKIDVEGFELSVLKGARAMLQKHAIRFIFMEVIHLAWENAGYSAGDVYDFMADHRYIPVTPGSESAVETEISREAFTSQTASGTRNVLWQIRQ